MPRYTVSPGADNREVIVARDGRHGFGAYVFTVTPTRRRVLRMWPGQWGGEHETFIQKFNSRRIPVGFDFEFHIETEE